MKKELDIIIPISIDLDWPDSQEIINDIIEQNQNYGFKRFALAMPGAGWRSCGYPQREFFEERAKVFNIIKEEVKKHGCECGWWITLTMKSGKTESFQSMIKPDGSEHPFANCPLCDNFRKRFCDDVAYFANQTTPAFIITEDDFSLSAAMGCFCDLHIAEFNKRYGYSYTRQELNELFNSKTDESFEVLREWREVAKDSLVSFAADIRKAVDQRNPEIPIGYMQAGSADKDGDCTVAISRAFAGEKHTPFSRLYGANYGGIKPRQIPDMLYHILYSKQHIDCDFKYYFEADTFPHTRFFTAGCQMISAMAVVFSYGFDGATFQTQQLLDNPNEEVAYGKAYNKERKRFETISYEVQDCELRGVSVDYDPFWYTADKVDDIGRPFWTVPLGRFGIPVTTLGSKVAFWDEVWAKHAPKEQVLDALSKVLFLDSAAANQLVKRGFGEYIGAEFGEDVADIGKNRWDLGTREIIRPEFCETKGKNMTCPWMLAPLGNGMLPKITITNPECEVVTELYSYHKELISPAMTRLKNKLGGTVIVMGLTLNHNGSQALYNYRRKKLIQNLIKNECDEFAFVNDAPDVMIIENRAKDGANKDFKELLTIINFCEDALDEVSIHLPKDLININQVEILLKEGKWQKQEFLKVGNDIIIDYPLNYCQPMYVKLK